MKEKESEVADFKVSMLAKLIYAMIATAAAFCVQAYILGDSPVLINVIAGTVLCFTVVYDQKIINKPLRHRLYPLMSARFLRLAAILLISTTIAWIYLAVRSLPDESFDKIVLVGMLNTIMPFLILLLIDGLIMRIAKLAK